MKIDDITMATPIEEKIDQNLKVSLINYILPIFHFASIVDSAFKRNINITKMRNKMIKTMETAAQSKAQRVVSGRCGKQRNCSNKFNNENSSFSHIFNLKKDAFLQVRTGMVMVSDGKSKPELARLQLTMEVITLQRPEPVMMPAVSPTAVLLSNQLSQQAPIESKERMVQITRDKEGGLGLSIKGGAEHKLPILISRIYKNHAADRTAQLFVGDAIIKVNGEYITACNHDDAVNILRNAGDIVVLTVKHYRAATPFLQKQCKFNFSCFYRTFSDSNR